jgi:hypothetical protein
VCDFIKSSKRAVAAILLLVVSVGTLAADSLPKSLSDETFWRMISEFSEPAGFFPANNFVSNESAFQLIIPKLTQMTEPGGVYVGVGPDQNFTYAVAVRPKIVFIIDIRRQNLVQHLMYKALIEMSVDRADFLSRLFSRPRPPDVNANTSVEGLFEAYRGTRTSKDLRDANFRSIMDQLIKVHGFKLTTKDEWSLEFIYNAFCAVGPGITYSGAPRRGPSYAELMTATDGEQYRSYLASEENFQILKQLEENNLVVPLVGDFAGPKVFNALAKYLREHDATVTALYTSNVEQYLFEEGDSWSRFYSNVHQLPLHSSSTLIRAIFGMFGTRTATLLASINQLMEAYDARQIDDYVDVIRMSN